MSSDHHDELPRIVSETPIGGKPRPIRLPIIPGDEATIPETPVIDEPAAEAESAPVEAHVIPETPIVDEPSAETPWHAAAPVEVEPAAPAVEPSIPAETPWHAAAPVEAAPAAEMAAPVPAVDAAEPAETPWHAAAPVPAPAGDEPVVAPSKSTAPVEPPPAAVSPSKVTWNEAGDHVADRSEWGDDLSPELASVLFGGGQPQSTARPSAAPASARPATPALATPAIPEAEAVIEPPTEPITLTDVAGARTLPITAHEISSPAPETLLTGKARYTRIEEPLLADQGQRTIEKWEYLKTDWPTLVGRLVQRVYVEEVSFADGSWRWVYERRYSDNGKDRREVRANKDHTLIERTDEIAKKDPVTGKGIRRKEFAAMILAAPASTEKPGFFSRLFGKHEDEPTGPKSWRPASSDEIRAGRKRGGSAF
jgi:hypothetical protein